MAKNNKQTAGQDSVSKMVALGSTGRTHQNAFASKSFDR